MPSPFPGMDPYLESPALWEDSHATFINYWREAIADRLPDHYEARIGERLVLESFEEDEADRVVVPDVTLHRRPDDRGGGVAVAEDIETLRPEAIPLLRDTTLQVPMRFLEIRRRPERSLVTVLELLSPSNKSGADREAYRARRSELIRQRVHLVELDLLTRGHRIPLARPLPPADYYCFVTRADRFPDCYVYSWTVRDPLPTLAVPLLRPDPSIGVDYGAVFRTAYERGRYAPSLAYDAPPPAALGEADLAWAAERGRSMRP